MFACHPSLPNPFSSDRKWWKTCGSNGELGVGGRNGKGVWSRSQVAFLTYSPFSSIITYLDSLVIPCPSKDHKWGVENIYIYIHLWKVSCWSLWNILQLYKGTSFTPPRHASIFSFHSCSVFPWNDWGHKLETHMLGIWWLDLGILSYTIQCSGR